MISNLTPVEEEALVAGAWALREKAADADERLQHDTSMLFRLNANILDRMRGRNQP